MVWVIDWGFLGGSPLLISRTKQTHGSWDTTGSLLLILFPLRFISQFQYALTSTLYVHRPPATMRDYLFVGGRDLLFPAPGFTAHGFLRSACLPLYFYFLSCRRCGPSLLFPFHVSVATLVFFPLLRFKYLVSLVFTSSSSLRKAFAFELGWFDH